MTLDTTARVLTLALHNKTPFHTDSSLVVIDIWTNRIAPNPGYTIADAVMTVLAEIHDAHADYWQDVCLYQLTSTLEADGFAHPVATYRPGAVQYCCTNPAHVPTDAAAITLHADTIDINGTVVPRDTFSPDRYTRLVDAQHRALANAERQSDTAYAAVLAAAAHHTNTQNTGRLERTVAPILSWMALHSTALGPVTGAEARGVGEGFAQRMLFALYNLWIVRPNTTTNYTAYVSTPKFAQMCAPYRDHPGWAMGMAAAELLCARDYDPKILLGKSTAGTGHQTLAHKTLERHLDRTLLAAAPMELLKPRAKRRAAKAA